MVTRLKVSLSEEQMAWVKSRKDEADFASVSDMIRDLIRRERDLGRPYGLRCLMPRAFVGAILSQS